MDFAALAALPLNVLAIVAVLYLLGQLIRWAGADRVRIQRNNALKHWMMRIVGATMANCVEMLPVLREESEVSDQLGPSQKALESLGARRTNTRLGQIQPGILDRAVLGSIVSAFRRLVLTGKPDAPSNPPAKGDGNTEGDYVLGQNYLDDPDLAKNLHLLPKEQSGYFFALIREVDAIYGLCAKVNIENDDATKLDALMGTLNALQFALLRAAIAAKATIDKDFRAKLVRTVSARYENEGDCANALYRLARAEIDNSIELCNFIIDDKKGLVRSPFTPDASFPASIGVVLFRQMRLEPERAPDWLGYAFAGLVIAAFVVLAFVPPVQNWLFPDKISCSTKITQPTGAIETTCTHSPASLAEGLAAGLPAGSSGQ